MRPYLEKNPSPKRAGGVARGVGPEFKPSTGEKKKKKKTEVESSPPPTQVINFPESELTSPMWR
jgi:hypothetical protein